MFSRFLKLSNNGIVAIVVSAAMMKANPSKPMLTPIAKRDAARVGPMVCANAASDHAMPNEPPCVSLGVLNDINVLRVVGKKLPNR